MWRTTYTYDANNNRVGSSVVRTTPGGPQTLVTSYAYDANNRLVRTTHPDGTSTSTVYDSAGRAVASVDELGRVTRSEYDSKGQLVRTVLPDGTTQASGYDANGNQVTSTDQAGRVTTTRYDNVDRPDRATYPDTTFTATGYDAAGRATAQTDEAGNTTTSVYDNDGRLLELRRPTRSPTVGAVTTSFVIDDLNPTGYAQVVDEVAAGVVTRSFAHGLDLISERLADRRVSFYGYDGQGSVRLLTDLVGARSEAYAYDGFGLLLESSGVTDNRYLYNGALATGGFEGYYPRARNYIQKLVDF